MYAWEAIQKSIDYIENNLSEDLTTEQLAKTANLSIFYFQRLLTKLVGKTVHEYIKARRVARAKDDIKNSEQRIIDIAMHYGFNSHEALTRAFKEIYNVTPEQYRKNEMTLTDFLKPDLSMNYTIVAENSPLIVDDMVIEIRKETRSEEEHFIGYSKLIEAVEMNKVGQNTLVSLWEKFNTNRANIVELSVDGVAIDYFATEKDLIRYFVGGQTTAQNIQGYDSVTLMNGLYYVCSFEAEDFKYLVTDALYKANQYFFETWLPSINITMDKMEPFLIQKYFDVDTEPRIEIWIKPIND